MGLNALSAIEHDFVCAGMCTQSRFYSFSDVGEGPTSRNCTQAINEYLESTTSATAGWFWAFGVITLLSFFYMIAFAARKHSELEHPLLGKQH